MLLQRGATIRILAPVPDLVEERIAVEIETTTGLDGLVKALLSSRLRYFHPANELVFVTPPRSQVAAQELDRCDLEVATTCLV